jgi:hypothetical protein
MVSPLFSLAASFEPNVISTYLSPSRPSDLIDATESFLRMSRVALCKSITTVTFSSGRFGKLIRFTVPTC